MTAVTTVENNLFYCVYGLFDPITDELVYIGFSQNVTDRFSDHRHLKQNYFGVDSNPFRFMWIESLRSIGKKPSLEVLFYSTKRKEAREMELELIVKYRAIGHPLLNRIPRLGDKQFMNILNKSIWIKERNISIFEGINL